MRTKVELKLHNRFDVEVRDAKTGALKQTAQAFNVICDNFFKAKTGTALKLPNQNQYPLQVYNDVLRYITVGDGAGVPAASDYAFFNAILSKTATTVETVYQYPTSYVAKQIRIESTECNGKNITEVGFTCGAYPAYPIITHAMLQDSEGHQISIAKTDTDVVVITATFYCTFTPSGFGDRGIYPAPDKNWLVEWMLTGKMNNTTGSVYVSSSRFPGAYSSDANERTKNVNWFQGTGDYGNLQYTLPDVTILDNEWPNHVVRSFGFPGIGQFAFPDPSIFPARQVDHLLLGSGDGVTQDFNVKCPLIKAGTARVFVNSRELSADEFDFDYESNCTDSLENYWTAGMTVRDDNVRFGNADSAGAGHLCDPLSWVTTASLNRTITVSQTNPIWIDFGESLECNRLKIPHVNVTIPATDTRFVIEYSIDNETWTRVEHSYNNRVFIFNSVSARYWRIYSTTGNWNYWLGATGSTVTTQDGVNSGASFFLGKTAPGLHLHTPPASGQAVEVSYQIDIPFKSANNIIRHSCTIQLSRG